jgi:hypothetical protein
MPSEWTRDKESLPTKPGKPSLKQLPNGRPWIQRGLDKQKQTETQNTSSWNHCLHLHWFKYREETKLQQPKDLETKTTIALKAKGNSAAALINQQDTNKKQQQWHWPDQIRQQFYQMFNNIF